MARACLLGGPVILMTVDQEIWVGKTRHLLRYGILFFESRGKIRQDADGPSGREDTTGG